MKYTLFVHSNRKKFLLELGDRVKIIKEEFDNGEYWTKLEVTVENSIDLMNIFHAGCRTGMETAISK